MVYINRRGVQDHTDDRGVLVEGASLVPDFLGGAINGYYHNISDINAYDKQTQQVVLNEQIIVNNSTLSPELMNNGFRCSTPYYRALSANEEVLLPDGALKNVQVNNEDTRMYYLFNKAWQDVQTDEFIVKGLFDFTIKLPSLPAGTYELNIGYSANYSRHIVDAYLDGELCGTIDQRITSNNLGWESDRELGFDEAAIAANDKQLFDQGYRKGLAYCYDNNNSKESLRDNESCLRRIITTFTTDGKSDHYLRFVNVNPQDDGTAQFMIDFLELCPTHLLSEYK